MSVEKQIPFGNDNKKSKDNGQKQLALGRQAEDTTPSGVLWDLSAYRLRMDRGDVYPESMASQDSEQVKLGRAADEGYVSFGHPFVMLKLASGESVEVDEGVVELVKLMNRIPGIETKGSCQGEEPHYGYVQFMPGGSEDKSHASIYFLYHMMRLMHAAWVKHRYAMGEHEKSAGREHPDAYRFKFTTELGNGYVMKWSPYTYPAVLAAAKVAAEETRRTT